MRVLVGDTILRAWGFAGRRIVPLLGASWLTAAFYAAALAYFLGHLSDAMLVSPRPDPGSFNNFALFYMFCVVLVTALANAAMAVPMFREAFETGGEWKTVYFSIAFREWALFSNTLLLYILIIGIVSAIAFAGSVGIAVSLPMIGNGGIWHGIPAAPVMIGILTIAALAAALFLATRFGFFLATTAVVDSPARLLRAWSLSRGNFWRILGLGLGLILPVVIAAILAIWAVCDASFGDAMNGLFSASHDNTVLFQMIHDHAGGIAVVCAIALLVLNAVFAGASEIAYARVEHGETRASSRERIEMAEPAYAVGAATAVPVGKADLERFEPKFSGSDTPLNATEPATPSPEEPTIVEAAAATPVIAGENTVQADKAQVEPSPAPSALNEAVSAEAAIAMPDAEPVLEATPETSDASTDAPTALPEEEPLAAHKDELPAMDPLGHAAPAAPDPSGAPPVTPLPSFVKAQPSPKSEPSEAA